MGKHIGCTEYMLEPTDTGNATISCWQCVCLNLYLCKVRCNFMMHCIGLQFIYVRSPLAEAIESFFSLASLNWGVRMAGDIFAKSLVQLQSNANFPALP